MNYLIKRIIENSTDISLEIYIVVIVCILLLLTIAILSIIKKLQD